MTTGRRPRLDDAALDRIERDLLAEFVAEGVRRIDYSIALMAPFRFSIWLGTETDRQRDTFPGGAADVRVRAVVAKHGMESLYRGFTVESQETVDRWYDGSWFFRRRG